MLGTIAVLVSWLELQGRPVRRPYFQVYISRSIWFSSWNIPSHWYCPTILHDVSL
jgi:hypothetical protein